MLFALIFFDAAAFLGVGSGEKRGLHQSVYPMLPVVAGKAETRKQILIYSLIMAPLKLRLR